MWPHKRLENWLRKPRVNFAFIMGSAPALVVGAVAGARWNMPWLAPIVLVGVWFVLSAIVYTFIDIKPERKRMTVQVTHTTTLNVQFQEALSGYLYGKIRGKLLEEIEEVRDVRLGHMNGTQLEVEVRTGISINAVAAVGSAIRQLVQAVLEAAKAVNAA